MSDYIQEQDVILRKLKIPQLNPMQEEAIPTIERVKNTILLSPTGTGKTLAFLLPIIKNLDIDCKEVQALILVPSRELAIQIEQVIRSMGSGFKVNAVYGGRPISESTGFLKKIADLGAKKLNLPLSNPLDTCHILRFPWICDGNRLYLSIGANHGRIDAPLPA